MSRLRLRVLQGYAVVLYRKTFVKLLIINLDSTIYVTD